jgi:signal transduction histidine kinase
MFRTQHLQGDISPLVNYVDGISPDIPLEDVAELFTDPKNSKLLSLPILENGFPIGVISRYKLMGIYLKRYARELYGKNPIRSYMNSKPMLLELMQPLSEAAGLISAEMQFPLTEDFIVTQQGKYLGVGFVIDLLQAMEQQLRENSAKLELANAQLKSSQIALVQSEKMASLGLMVAGIAHEINTPLGYVQNNVVIGQELFQQVQLVLDQHDTLINYLLDDQATEEQIAAHIQLITEFRNDMNTREMFGEMKGMMDDTLYGISQISELVLNLKNFSRIDSIGTENVNINECIDSALKIGRNVLKGTVEIVKDLGEIPKITCAPSELNQVFLNIFTNAAQAMDVHGRLYIKTWSDDNFIFINVDDNGKGIPENLLPRIFDPFFTTKPVGQGTGLGLAITHQIIHKHSGEIQVESQVGKGTRFSIKLPISAPKLNNQALLLEAAA